MGHWEGVVGLLDVRGEAGYIGGDGDDALLFEGIVVLMQHVVQIFPSIRISFLWVQWLFLLELLLVLAGVEILAEAVVERGARVLVREGSEAAAATRARNISLPIHCVVDIHVDWLLGLGVLGTGAGLGLTGFVQD